MSTLIVLLPSGNPVAGESAGVRDMPFAVFGRRGEPEGSGWSGLEALPKADATVLIVAARDTLLLNVKLPPVTGPRLERLLPNAVEEHLIQDAQRSHIAIDPAPFESGERCVAVLDREWFAGVLGQFSAAGHRGLRAVPLTRCIPLHEADSEIGGDRVSAVAPVDGSPSDEAAMEVEGGDATAGIREAVGDPSVASVTGADDVVVATTPVATALAATTVLIVGREQTLARIAAGQGDADWVELAVRQGALGYGVSVSATALETTLSGIAEGELLAVYDLAVGKEGPGGREGVLEAPHIAACPAGIEGLPWERVAREALACRFNLCQFAFAHAGRVRPGEGGLRRWRVALGFAGAAVAVSIVAVNVQWFQLRHRRDALNEEMTQLVKEALPGATVVLDPHEQMAVELKRMRQAGGELRPDDFLALAAALSRALPPVPSTALAGLDYSDGALDVTFRPGTEMDEDALTRRLAAQGVSALEDNGKWTLKSARPGPR